MKKIGDIMSTTLFSTNPDTSAFDAVEEMYKNKIGAVAREISSNSRDANREAGRSDSPIAITISSENNLLSEETNSISFQDNGVGISPERMDNIFLKYGGSTKRDSDEFTGGFGIGAKTPFAYTDRNEFTSKCVWEKIESNHKI